MKTIEIIGFKRANLGKKEARDLRLEGNIPCVLYGGKDQVHFHTPAFLLRDLIYTGDVHTVDLYVDKQKYKCILQDIQFNPVNDSLNHVDFLLLQDNKPVKMEIPVRFEGTSVGVAKGGKFIPKMKKLTVKALPSSLPDVIKVDISGLEIGKSVKVGDLKAEGYTILNPKSIPVASVVITRQIKVDESADKGAAKTAAPAAKAATPAADKGAAKK